MKIIFYSILLLTVLACNDSSKNKSEVSPDRLLKQDTTLKWVDYRMGELPPAGTYDAFDSVVRKWHLRYERIEGGCEMLEDEKKQYEKDNPKYFAILEQKFGTNWREKFDAEVAAMELLLEKKSNSEKPDKQNLKAIDKEIEDAIEN